jgi:hypothetical protein
VEETPCQLNTHRRFSISIVVLAVSVILTPIPTTAQQGAEPPSEGKQGKSQSQPRNNTNGTQKVPSNDLRGTDNSPIVVKVLPTPKTNEETAQEEQTRKDQSDANWWMVRLTAFIGFIALIQTVVFGIQALRLKQTVIKMEEIAKGQTSDMKASIGEATRAAAAMEGIAKSMDANAQSMKVSVGISREIADRQKLVTELTGRAYLSATLNTAIFQDEHHVFEASAVLTNRGSTPAYDVTFRSTVGILPYPIPDNFDFPLPDETIGPSVSLIAPGLTKLLFRRLSERVPDNEVPTIKNLTGQHCFVLWGTANYRDAFKEPRYLKFAFMLRWLGWIEGMGKDKDGNPRPETVYSVDTAHHNEAN